MDTTDSHSAHKQAAGRDIKPNKGGLFYNKRKTDPKHADMTGKLNVDGRLYWVNAWINKSERGEWISLSIKPVDEIKKTSDTPF